MTATETLPINPRAAVLAAMLRESGCGTADRWREHANRCGSLLHVLKRNPCDFEEQFRQCLRLEGWTHEEAAPLARELAAMSSWQIRVALEAEQLEALSWVEDLDAGRRRDYRGEKV